METSLETQIGGSHYKALSYQPITFIVRMRCNFIQGNIIKYVSRYKRKNGKQDLLKVIHYVQLGIELHPDNYCSFGETTSEEVHRYVKENNFSSMIEEILFSTITQNWLSITDKVKTLIDTEYE